MMVQQPMSNSLITSRLQHSLALQDSLPLHRHQMEAHLRLQLDQRRPC